MRRLILSAPEDFNTGELSPAQEADYSRLFYRVVHPMPGTLPQGGSVLIDALMPDRNNPQDLQYTELPLEVVGAWLFNGYGALEMVPLDEHRLLQHLPPQYDETGEMVPRAVYEPHKFDGWPPLVKPKHLPEIAE